MVGWGRAVRYGGAVQGRMGGGAGGRAARHGGAVQGRIVGGGLYGMNDHHNLSLGTFS